MGGVLLGFLAASREQGKELCGEPALWAGLPALPPPLPFSTVPTVPLKSQRQPGGFLVSCEPVN